MPLHVSHRILAAVAVAGLAVTAGAQVPYTENFDGVTAPALAPGWTQSTDLGGADPHWITVSDNFDTAPNSVHVDNPTEVSDKSLYSPPIHIYTNQAYVVFRRINYFARGAYESFVDGGVLEISVDGGPFQDVVDAGGSADYDGVIIGDANPLAWRQGWVFTGTEGFTFLESNVTLPPVGGKTIVLRFRMGTTGGDSISGYFGWSIDSIHIYEGAYYSAVPQPVRFDTDPAENAVWEPGESVDLDPFFYNNGSETLLMTGSIIGVSGPVPGAEGLYEILDSNADYGTIPPGALGGCVITGNCYRIHLKDPGGRLAPHWDAQFEEQLSNSTSVTWAVHIGGSFTDVPKTNGFYYYVETAFHNGVTGGCGTGTFCPDGPALRKQMAVFLLKSLYGPSYVPPSAAGIFADVPASDPFAPWIENLYNLGITGGCSNAPLQYCPDQTVLRKQMAVFLLKTEYGSSYTPPACQGLFQDVPCPSSFADWIEDLYSKQIAAGCGGSDFCPNNPNTRGQMATFLTKTFGLKLNGP